MAEEEELPQGSRIKPSSCLVAMKVRAPLYAMPRTKCLHKALLFEKEDAKTRPQPQIPEGLYSHNYNIA
jgi:hypothetical protein